MCEVRNLFRCVNLRIIALACFWHEDIDAYRVGRLVTVAGKPSDITIFVDDKHIVIGLAVERHADVDGLQEALGVFVVCAGVDVVSSQTVVAFCSKIKCLTIA